MSATYNWSYKGGVSNKYGFVIPVTTDDVRPYGTVYVALFGNDSTGNGSRQYPFKTFKKGFDYFNSSGEYYGDFSGIILGAGVYREPDVIDSRVTSIVGDGDVVLDITYTGSIVAGGQGRWPIFYNLTVKGDGLSSCVMRDGSNNGFIGVDCVFDGTTISSKDASDGSCQFISFTGCVFKNISQRLVLRASTTIVNTTFYNCNNVNLGDSLKTRALVFANCNICATPSTMSLLQWCLFYQCNFRFTNDGNGGTLYPSVPTGYNYYSAIADLQAAYTTAYGIPSFQFCKISDPLFNNVAIGDFTLNFNSPAKNLSYFGTYVGARSIGYAIKASATESNGSFELSSAVNLTIADNSITLTNPAVDGRIDTNTIVNKLGRELSNFKSFGFNADRNGQYIDSIADLDSVTKGAGSTLNVPAPYLVENGAIVYNGNTYTAGSRFTTVAGQTVFTTATGGVVREITEAPQRHTIMARFSDGGAVVPSGTALTSGYYYYVQTGSVTYNSVVYSSGDAFKAVDTNAFSGSGTVIVAFATESFQHYEPGTRPTSNNVGDSRTGAIIRGNGDPAYVRGSLGVQEFPINAKFIQVRYYIRVNNLKP